MRQRRDILNTTRDRDRRGTTYQAVIQKNAVCCKKRSCLPVTPDEEIKCSTAFKIPLGKPSGIGIEEGRVLPILHGLSELE